MLRPFELPILCLTVVLSLLSPAARAADQFADSFPADAGQSQAKTINGRPLPSGGEKWRADASLCILPTGGVTATKITGGSATFPVPPIAGQYHLQARVKVPRDKTFIGIALGGETLPLDFFHGAQISVGIIRDGRFEIRAAGFAKPLCFGTAQAYGGVATDGTVDIDVSFDGVTSQLTVQMNQKTLVDHQSLAAGGYEAQISSAGFRFNGPVQSGDGAVQSFSLTLTSRATAGLVPSHLEQFFVTPDTDSSIGWHAATVVGQALKYELLDYTGATFGQGTATVSQTGEVSAIVKLPLGFYELRFPENGQRFGIASIPPVKPSDPFFCIDAGLSWPAARGTDNYAQRESLIKILRRSGIAAARERSNWAEVNPTPDKWNWETGRQFETVRDLYKKYGLTILDMMYGAPAYMGISKRTPFPQNLGLASPSWQEVAEKYHGVWAGTEVWNEPDLIRVPADQYVPMVKTAAYAQDRAKCSSPVVAGVFANAFPGIYNDVCAANEMLDFCDAVSFHTYDAAIELTKNVGGYRKWLAKWNKQSMPLWLTEAGKHWPAGPNRPPIGPDSATAMAMASFASEARATGCARIFPFYLQYYEEGGVNNFGMMGREWTPLRSLAAYITSIRLLSGQPYAGDIDGISGANSVRAFGNGDQQLLVIYMQQIDPATKVSLGVPIIRVAGIDGRALALGADGSVPVPDGLGYAWAAKTSVAPLLKTDSATRQLYEMARASPPARPQSQSVVLTHSLEDDDTAKISPRRYLLNHDSAKSTIIHVQACNLSTESQNVTLTLTPPGGTAGPAPMTLQMPALGSVQTTWTIDLSRSLDVAEIRYVKITGKTSDGTPISSLAIPYLLEGTLKEQLARASYAQPLPLTQLRDWSRNITALGSMTMSVTPDHAFRFDATFTKTADNWVYPFLHLNQPIDSVHAKGLVIRARILKSARNVDLMLQEGQKPGFWMTEILPADGEWHTAYLPFSDFVFMPGNPDMQNALLRIGKVNTIGIGFGSGVQENAMEISDLVVVGDQ